jgi:hypothetical protein
MTSSSPQSGHGWLAPLIVTVLITLTILTWLDKWLYSNEVFNNLSMGLSYSPKDPLLVELKEQALHYCTQYATDSELKECNIYQDAITDDLYFAHPLTALIGLQARKLLDNPDSWTELHRIALEPPHRHRPRPAALVPPVSCNPTFRPDHGGRSDVFDHFHRAVP